MNEKHIRGRLGEDYTAEYLINKGMTILYRNYRKKGGELDIVAINGSELVVTEVKTRKFGSLTDGIEAVTKTKIKNIIRTAQQYIDENDIDFTEMRFDVAEVTVTTDKIPQVICFNYIENAFDGDNLD